MSINSRLSKLEKQAAAKVEDDITVLLWDGEVPDENRSDKIIIRLKWPEELTNERRNFGTSSGGAAVD